MNIYKLGFPSQEGLYLSRASHNVEKKLWWLELTALVTRTNWHNVLKCLTFFFSHLIHFMEYENKIFVLKCFLIPFLSHPLLCKWSSRRQTSKGLDCSFPSQLVHIQNANLPGYFQGEYSFHDDAGVIYSLVEMTCFHGLITEQFHMIWCTLRDQKNLS